MDNYEYLYHQLQYWRKELTRLKQEKKKWETRKRDVEDIKSSLRSVGGSGSSNVNSRISWSVSSLERSIEYPMRESSLDTVFAGKNEYPVDGDVFLTNANNEIIREIKNCDNEIEELNRSISIAQDNVARYQREINRLRWG